MCRAETPERTFILLGTETDYPPYSFLDASGRPVGFNVELAEAVAQVMGVRMKIRCGAWGGLRQKLERGEIHAIGGMYYSPQREKGFDFSPPYCAVHHTAFARLGFPPAHSKDDLRGKELIVMRSDIMHDYVLENRLTERLVLVDTPADALRLLASGRHDYALVAKLPGLYWIKRLALDNVVPAGSSIRTSDYCFAVCEGDAKLASRLSEGLAIIKQTGRYKQIHDKWLGVLEPRGIPVGDVLKYAWFGMLGLIVLIGGFVVWSQTLKRQVAERTVALNYELAEGARRESALRASEERLTSIVSNASEIIYTLSAEGIFTFVSPAWTAKLGHRLPEVEGHDFRAFVHPDDVPVCEAFLKEILAHGKTERKAEYRVRHKDGSWHWHTSAGSRARDPDESFHYVGVAEDITERKQAEAALRESERRLTTLIGNLKGMAYRCKNSPEWTMEFVSQGCVAVTGYQPEDLVGNRKVSYGSLILAEDRAQVYAQVQKALAARQAIRLEYRVVTASREIKWVWEHGNGVYSEDGEVLALEGYVTDISERKSTEDALRRQKALLEGINRVFTEAMVADSDEAVAKCGLRVATELTQSSVGFIGETTQDGKLEVIFFGQEAEKLQDTAGPEGSSLPEEEIRRFCGRIVEAEEAAVQGASSRGAGGATPEDFRRLPALLGVPLKQNGATVRVIGVANPAQGYEDTHKETLEPLAVALGEALTKKRAERQLARAKDAAEAANRAKSEFLANMSHEIRTPMTAILGYAEILAENATSAQDIDAATTVRRNGEHLLGIINGILDLSKIEAGKLAVESVPCSPHAILAEVVLLMRVPAQSMNLSLNVEYSGPIPALIHTDPARLRQILINLIGNAIKFTEVGGVNVAVRHCRDGAHSTLEFEIADSGIGMTDAEVEDLFQPFFQVQGASNRKFGGTGLGLAISRRLARLLGGNITVQSIPQKGSTFTLTINTGDPQGVKFIEGPSEPSLPEQTTATIGDCPARLNCRILLAEDGPDNQRLISFLLRKAGAEVVLAENGQIAVEQALSAETSRPFQVVLMDMQMPVLDGYEATMRLRRGNYARPIIALTAHAMAEDRQQCLDAGCDDYLSKPVDRQKLLELVAKHAGAEPNTPPIAPPIAPPGRP